MTRTDDVIAARKAADDWAASLGLPPSGAYSGSWYENSYLGGWWPDGWLKWWADYNGSPGSLIGADVVAHQYASSPIDSDVMLESEIVTQDGGTPVDDTERVALQAQIDGLVTTVADIADRLGDQLLAECKRPGVRKATVRAVVAEMEAERAQAVGPRP
jgi:hypothetical protein